MDEIDSTIMIKGRTVSSGIPAQKMAGFPQTGDRQNVSLNGYIELQGQIHCPQEVQTIATTLAKDIVYYYSKRKSKTTATCSHCKTLRRTVDELSEKHDLVFNRIVNKLQITEQTGKEVFLNVAEEMFSDRTYNWGRVVSLYAFVARLGRYCFDHDLDHYVDTLAEYCGQFIAARLGQWIHSQGGWKAFDEYFPDPKATEETWWKGLVFTAVGLGALATMVAVK